MEILCPAGTIKSLQYAINAGADAVYLGLGELNARAKSVDFNLDNFLTWVGYCHSFNVKVYLTLNVNIFDWELDRAIRLVKLAYLAKVDALIVSDIGLILSIREMFPDFPVHVSTQAGVKDSYGADFFKELGAKRVVLARETRLSDIKDIKGIETEMFVHGALCVAFSGNCLLSCSIGGYSGNRGECRQPCRQLYTAYDMNGNKLKEGYLLSAKDICLEKYIEELKQANVTSLKIEGRLKSPEYAFVSTKFYKDLTSGKQSDKTDLILSYNRGGFTPAYFEGKKVIYTKTASHIGLPVAKILKTETRKGFTFATVDNPLSKGDGVKVLRNGYEVGGADITSCVESEDNWLIPTSKGVRKGDSVCLTKSADLAKRIENEKRLIPIDFHLHMRGSESKFIAKCGNSKVEWALEEPATDRELTYKEIANQLSKTGGTKFFANLITYSGHGYYPKSFLNNLRTTAISKIERQLIRDYSPQRVKPTDALAYKVPENNNRIQGEVVESENFEFDFKNIKNFVFYPKVVSLSVYKKAVEFARKNDLKLFIKFPTLVKKEEMSEYVDFARENNIGVYANNVSVVQCAREKRVPYIAGIELNITNKDSEYVFSDSALVLASVEMGNDRLSYTSYVYTYGRLPLMSFEHCPNCTVTGLDCDRCVKKSQNLIFKHENDEYLLRGVRTKNRCYYTLYSGKKLNKKIKDDNRYINLIEDGNIPVFDNFEVN